VTHQIGSNDYDELASDFAHRKISGSDTIAFQVVANRVATLRPTGMALDLGCGTGRSTRFLKELGLQTAGLDLSESMIWEARRLDPEGRYLTYEPNTPLPFKDQSFEVLLASWVTVEIAELSDLQRLMFETARVLSSNGTGFIIANTADFYAGQWVSGDVDFPENKPPLQSGQRVKTRLLPEGIVVTDIYWSDEDYGDVFSEASLRVSHSWKPTAPQHESGWLDETRKAPFVVYEVRKTVPPGQN